MERERMKREEENEERERERIMTCQPGDSQAGDGRIKNATSAGMLRWCQYLSLEKGRASI